MHTVNEMRHRSILRIIARRAMLERGLAPDFSQLAIAELGRIRGPAKRIGRRRSDVEAVRDLRSLPWCSIDNDDSLDLDQLTVAESLPDGAIKVLVAISDVDAVVRNRTAIDDHARLNTTSVYTVAVTFPMLPEWLSTDFTSLKPEADRFAIVIEMVLSEDGTLSKSDLYRAMVRNRARLAYDSVASWLDGKSPPPAGLSALPGLDDNLRLQDAAARRLKSLRLAHGALDLETIQTRPVFAGDELKDLALDVKNGAKGIIEELMIAANGITARYLAARNLPSLRRIVRVPKNWTRIAALAAERGTKLPAKPDPKALADFLAAEKAADPLRFPDLSFSVVKLLGRGEYAVQVPGSEEIGHFGLAVNDYAHSTAPNRRYPDLVTQRLLKAAMAGASSPYGLPELEELAKQCTVKEDAANKVERQVEKSAAAMLLEGRIGESFDSIVTGASEKGTWVRLMRPPVEGRLMSGYEGADVGDRMRVRLASVNIERGYVDFESALRRPVSRGGRSEKDPVRELAATGA